MKNNLKVRNLDDFDGVDEEDLKRYDELGFVTNVVNHKNGSMKVECENGLLVIDQDGCEEIFATHSDNSWGIRKDEVKC